MKFDLSPFKRGDVDAFPVFRNTQGIELKKQLEPKIRTLFISPVDVGVISYSNLYFSTKDIIKSNPTLVQEFVTGIIKGWEFAQSHVEETTAIVNNYDTQTPINIIEASIIETNRLVKPNKVNVIGEMTKYGWLQTQKVLRESGTLKKNLPIEQLFTNEFVKVAQENK